MLTRALIILSFFLVLAVPVMADDGELWTSLELDKALSKQIDLSLEQELRLDEQYSHFKNTFTDVTIYWETWKDVRLLGGYRFSVYNDKIKQRLSVGGEYSYGIGNIDFGYRLKYQQTHEADEATEKIIRNRVGLAYDMPAKFKPNLNLEIFNIPGDEWDEIDELRLSLGLKYRWTKKMALKIFYILKIENFIRDDLEKINIFGLKYDIKI